MIFGGLGQERIQLNESTLWGGGPYQPVNPAAKEALPRVRQLIFDGQYEEAEKLAESDLLGTPKRQCAYQALGNLLLEMPGFDDAQATDYRRELDLDAAISTTRFTRNGTQYRREVLASHPDQVIAIRLTAEGQAASISIAASPRPRSAPQSMRKAPMALSCPAIMTTATASPAPCASRPD
jgi:alpha-L-fucosidase 2